MSDTISVQVLDGGDTIHAGVVEYVDKAAVVIAAVEQAQAYADTLFESATAGPMLQAARAAATSNYAGAYPFTGLPSADDADGITLAEGDVFLLTAQTAASRNGPWIVSAGAWSRPTDYAGAIPSGKTVEVLAGDTNALTTWEVTGAGTVDSNTTTWARLHATLLTTETGGVLTGVVNARTNNGAVGDGTTDDHAALTLADTATGSWGARGVFLPSGTYRIASNLTLTSPVVFAPGAVLKPDSGVTVTVPLDGESANLQRQIADHSAGGVVMPVKVDGYRPAWWGPVGTSDDSAAWQDMTTSIAALKTATGLGSKVIPSQGVNNIWDVTLTYTHLAMSQGVHQLSPAGSPTSGAMLIMDSNTTISSGTVESLTLTNISLLKQIGARCWIDGTYVRQSGSGTIGFDAEPTSGSITPRLINCIFYNPNGGTPGSGTGTGVYLDSSDAEFTNVWIAQCDVGMNQNKGSSTLVDCHIWNNASNGIISRDSVRIIGGYIESNGGWGIDATNSDRIQITGTTLWRNGRVTAGTGGIKFTQAGGASGRDNKIDVILDDNIGTGVLIDGTTDGITVNATIASQSVQTGGAPQCTYGVHVTSTPTNIRIKARAANKNLITAAVYDESGAADIDLGRTRRVGKTAISLGTGTTSYTAVASIPVHAKDSWYFKGWMIVDATQTSDIKMRFQATNVNSPAGMFTITPGPLMSLASTTSASVNPVNAAAIAASAGTAVTFGGAGTGVYQAVHFEGWLDVDAGTTSTSAALVLQVGPNTSDTTACNVQAFEIEAVRRG